MSRKRRTNNRHNLENEKPTRKSARLNNSKNDHSECQAQEKRTREKSQRSINTCTVMITRSRGKCVEPDIGFPKPDVSSITEENGMASTSDSDGNFVKTLTYSSSDSNSSKRNMSKRSNVLRNSCGQMVVKCKKTVDEKESSEKENEQAANVEGMKSVKNQRGYNLRSKSKKQVAVESGSDTSSVIEDKHVVTKKAQKTKLKDKKNENNTKHSVRDTEASKQFAKPSISNLDQGKGVKKSKGKKTGTLARKRELRDMLEQQDEGYEDDAFEGTPFRNIKPLIKYKLSPIILDTSIHCGSSDSEFKTPCSRTPVNRLRPAGPLSTGPSDSDTGIMTPGLLNSVNRNDIDRYVNRLKRRNMGLGCKTKIKYRTPFAKKHYGILQTRTSFDFDTNCNVQKSTTTESEYCEEDYYWSDME